MPHSVIEAIQMGYWDYEPDKVADRDFESTEALPGTNEKLAVMAKRIARGQPLWHPADRLNYERET